jgi:tRNA pseudouridine(55) synthase
MKLSDECWEPYVLSSESIESILAGKPYVLLVWKPVGPTSFDVIRRLQHLFRQYCGPSRKAIFKIGHFGTLDPFACGLMMIAFNRALKLADFVHEYGPKTYMAIGERGFFTDTGDSEGELLQKEDEAQKGQQGLEALASTFKGEYWQKPSRYSATKYQGKCLYEWARAGVEVPLVAKKRYIYDIHIQRESENYVLFQATVSSGTYIRVLMEDMMSKAGGAGHLIGLIRTALGSVHENLLSQKTETLSLSLEQLFPDIIRVPLSEEIHRAWSLGQKNAGPDLSFLTDFPKLIFGIFQDHVWFIPVERGECQKPLFSLANF